MKSLNYLSEVITVYIKNYRIGGTPQLVTGVGYKYNAKQHWFAGVNFNYCD